MSSQPLTGPKLISKVKELSGATNKKEIARACGYYSFTKAGKERVNLAGFLNAVLSAQGLGVEEVAEKRGRGGREANFRIQVQKNGNLLIGPAYTRSMGLLPGDTFEIALGRKHIKLIHVLEDGDDLPLVEEEVD